MGHHDKLRKIDIPAATVQIVESIVRNRKQHILAGVVEEFFKTLQGRRIDARAAGKLYDILVESTPDLKVHRVAYHKDAGVPPIQPVSYRFTISMYDMEPAERHFLLRVRSDGTLNIDDAMVADRRWKAHADFLESKLPRFAHNAQRFNNMVHALQQQCEEACMPGDPFPVYPLSDFYHWYQLHA